MPRTRVVTAEDSPPDLWALRGAAFGLPSWSVAPLPPGGGVYKISYSFFFLTNFGPPPLSPGATPDPGCPSLPGPKRNPGGAPLRGTRVTPSDVPLCVSSPLVTVCVS